MISVYALDLRPYGDTWQEFLPQLPQERQKRALACRNPEDGLRIAGAGWLLSRALEKAGIPLSRQTIEITPYGKPYLKNRQDVHFSLSHAGHWAVCALGSEPLGVDVEKNRCTMALARRCFHPKEVAYLEALPEEGQRAALTMIWTAKEAYIKAIGQGIPMNRFALEELDWNFSYGALEDFAVCLCAKNETPCISFENIV